MRITLLALLLVVPAAAMAQPSQTTDVNTMHSDDCAKARKAGKTCVLTIDDEDIEGGVPTAGETKIEVLTFGTMASLIRLRRDFIPEILKSAEDID